MNMVKNKDTAQAAKIKRLKDLAWVLFELADNETSKESTESLCAIAAGAKQLFDQAERDLHPDLGLELLEFVYLKDDSLAEKKSGQGDAAEGAAVYRQRALEILEALDCCCA